MSAAHDESWFAAAARADREHRAQLEKCDQRISEKDQEIGKLRDQLRMARELSAQFAERLQEKARAISSALESLEAHDEEHRSLNGADPDPHLVCAFETLQAVSS